MARYTNKVTGVTVDIGDADTLPGQEMDWDAGDGTPAKRTRRRADTGTIPTQQNQ